MRSNNGTGGARDDDSETLDQRQTFCREAQTETYDCQIQKITDVMGLADQFVHASRIPISPS